MASEDYISVRRLMRFYDKLKVWLFKNYASKSYVDAVAHAGMHDLGTKTESNLSNGKLAIGCGNSNTELTLTTVSALTVLANSGVPNFALLVDNSGNSNAVTVTVKDSTDENPLLQSTAAGNKVSAGKICQITCVGRCWTLAEFEAPA
jgi:hypothetical protein